MAPADDDATRGGGPAESADVGPNELQRQIEDIKGAMGLAERYPGRARLWLFAGLLIGVAALFTQATFYFADRLDNTAYTVIWGGFVLVAVAASWWMASRLPQAEAPASAPSWRAIFGSLAVFLFAATGVLGDVATAVDGLDRGVLFFGLAIATVGLGLLITGAVLSSYRVRRRDRLVFYAGGVWVLALASVIPHVQLLRYVGVGLFGALFILYAIGAYVYLTRA